MPLVILTAIDLRPSHVMALCQRQAATGLRTTRITIALAGPVKLWAGRRSCENHNPSTTSRLAGAGNNRNQAEQLRLALQVGAKGASTVIKTRKRSDPSR